MCLLFIDFLLFLLHLLLCLEHALGLECLHVRLDLIDFFVALSELLGVSLVLVHDLELGDFLELHLGAVLNNRLELRLEIVLNLVLLLLDVVPNLVDLFLNVILVLL